jgi:hypothetical protein
MFHSTSLVVSCSLEFIIRRSISIMDECGKTNEKSPSAKASGDIPVKHEYYLVSVIRT